ncbi:MAG: CCA tRNA nucleotidyltransferase [Alphaproteobacteria bacterium]
MAVTADRLVVEQAPSLAGAAWLSNKKLHRVLEVLNAHGQARIVGGAVRDALLGRPVGDIDLATTLVPDLVTRHILAAGMGCVPTGIDHGTVTVVEDGQPFEVTTLRRDVRTHGRHATVAFTKDWDADARRRDFTMNALYANGHGQVFDPLSGYDDLLARHVRFIGDARARIEEDYLRILRFFRFHAQLGRGSLDGQGLAQAGALAPGLAGISRERVRAELLALLAGRGVLDAVRAMEGAGIFAALDLPGVDCDRLARLVAIEGDRQVDPVRRLAALAGNGTMSPAELALSLRLSKKEAGQLKRYSAQANLTPALSAGDINAALYRLGAPAFADCVLFNWSARQASAQQSDWQALLDLARDWAAPHFPLTGADLIDAGLAPGPQMGAMLEQLRTYWAQENFRPDRAALLARIIKY